MPIQSKCRRHIRFLLGLGWWKFWLFKTLANFFFSLYQIFPLAHSWIVAWKGCEIVVHTCKSLGSNCNHPIGKYIFHEVHCKICAFFLNISRTITIVISMNFTYLDNLEATMTLEVTHSHILFVGFSNCDGCSAP